MTELTERGKCEEEGKGGKARGMKATKTGGAIEQRKTNIREKQFQFRGIVLVPS